jgi:hypothetical protein
MSRNPAAICRFVIPIWVNAIQFLFAERTFAHIGQEVLKIIPSCADGNSSPTVVVKASIRGNKATLAHVHPNFVDGIIRSPVTHTLLTQHRPSKTSATSSVTGLQISCSDTSRASAGTKASPSCSPAFITGSLFKDGELTESLPNQARSRIARHSQTSM